MTHDTTTYSVYCHTVPNGKRYIGISYDPEKRWKKGLGYKRNPYFYADIVKYGWDNITHEILYEGLAYQFATQVEHNLIMEFQTLDKDKGYNRSPSGDASNVTEETRAKMSAIRMGNKYSLGHYHPEERKRRISESLKKHYAPSPEHPNGLHGANWGKKWDEDSRKKLSISRQNASDKEKAEWTSRLKHYYGGEHPNSRKVYRISEEGEKVLFLSMSDAVREMSLSGTQGIVRVCTGKQKMYVGYYWEYA